MKRLIDSYDLSPPEKPLIAMSRANDPRAWNFEPPPCSVPVVNPDARGPRFYVINTKSFQKFFDGRGEIAPSFKGMLIPYEDGIEGPLYPEPFPWLPSTPTVEERFANVEMCATTPGALFSTEWDITYLEDTKDWTPAAMTGWADRVYAWWNASKHVVPTPFPWLPASNEDDS